MEDRITRGGTAQPRTSSDAPISPVKMAHLLLLTPCIAPMRDWYANVLQAHVVHENERMCFLTYDDEHHRIALASLPDLRNREEGRRPGVHHVAFTYRGLDDLLRTYKRLRDQGITPHWPVNHGMTTSLYYADPDGNGVELQVDNFGTGEEARAYFSSAAFAANPVGVVFDPEELLARREAGEAVEELLKMPPLPQGKTPLDMLRL